MSVLIATPCYDGQVCSEYLHSLLKATITVDFELALITGVHFIDTARDIAAAKLLDSKHEYLMFIDSDLGWNGDAISQLISHNKDIVGGAYRIKHDTELYPVDYRANETQDGLLRANSLPGGFLCIHRRVIERMASAYPSYQFVVKDSFKRIPALFSRALMDDRMVSEDIMFCKRASAAGFDLWLDPTITFGHIGSKAFIGNFATYLEGQQ